MNKRKRLYISLRLLLLAQSLLQCKNESITIVDNLSIQAPLNIEHKIIQDDIIEDLEDKDLSPEEEIDKELYEIFAQFFNEHDKTPFSKIVTKVIAVLKRKKATLHGAEMLKCDEIIKNLERNKTNHHFPTWTRILTNSDLLNLMSEETRSYLDSISNFIKAKTLINRLRIY